MDFTICNDRLEIWGNRTNANKLIFAISSATQNIFSINAVNISIENIISKLQAYKVKVSKVCFEDFLFSEDIVGNFTVDLSTYGDVFAVLNKYKEKIARMTAILPCEGTSLKICLLYTSCVIAPATRLILSLPISPDGLIMPFEISGLMVLLIFILLFNFIEKRLTLRGLAANRRLLLRTMEKCAIINYSVLFCDK